MTAMLTGDMAFRFETAFGPSPETMMRMLAAYEFTQARAHDDEILVERVAA